MNKQMTALAVFTLTFLSIYSLKAEDWWNKNWGNRVKLTIKNPGKVELKDQPVIITGKDFIKKTGFVGLNTLSLRLIKDGKELPVQVDERDKTEFYQKDPNYKLDNNDEIVFQATIAPESSADYYLYFSLLPRPSGEYTGDVKLEYYDSDKFGQIRVSNPFYNLFLKGVPVDQTAKTEKLTFANSGCGSITSLEIKGKQILHSNANWSQTLPGWLLNTEGPVVAINGPVRKVIQVNWKGIRDYKKETAYDGKRTRYFSFYNDCGRIDFEEIFSYRKWDLNLWSRLEGGKIIKYTTYFAAGILDRNDSLLLPLMGKSYEINIEKLDLEKFKAPGESHKRFYSTDKPESGWFAWYDNKDKLGMGVLFNPSKFSVNITSLNIIKSLDAPYGNPRSQICYKLSSLGMSKSLFVKFAFCVITRKEQAEEFYNFWKSPQISFGMVEQTK